TSFDHVLAQVLLLLRASEEELPRALRVSRPRPEGSASATRRSRVEVEDLSHHSDQASRRGRAAHHRLASGSVRAFRCAGGKGSLDARHGESQAPAEAQETEGQPAQKVSRPPSWNTRAPVVAPVGVALVIRP